MAGYVSMCAINHWHSSTLGQLVHSEVTYNIMGSLWHARCRFSFHLSSTKNTWRNTLHQLISHVRCCLLILSSVAVLQWSVSLLIWNLNLIIVPDARELGRLNGGDVEGRAFMSHDSLLFEDQYMSFRYHLNLFIIQPPIFMALIIRHLILNCETWEDK